MKKQFITLMMILTLAPMVVSANEDYRGQCVRTIKDGREAMVSTAEVNSCLKISSDYSYRCVRIIANGRQSIMNHNEITACSFIKSESAASCVSSVFNGNYYAGFGDILGCTGF